MWVSNNEAERIDNPFSIEENTETVEILHMTIASGVGLGGLRSSIFSGFNFKDFRTRQASRIKGSWVGRKAQAVFRTVGDPFIEHKNKVHSIIPTPESLSTEQLCSHARIKMDKFIFFLQQLKIVVKDISRSGINLEIFKESLSQLDPSMEIGGLKQILTDLIPQLPEYATRLDGISDKYANVLEFKVFDIAKGAAALEYLDIKGGCSSGLQFGSFVSEESGDSTGIGWIDFIDFSHINKLIDPVSAKLTDEGELEARIRNRNVLIQFDQKLDKMITRVKELITEIEELPKLTPELLYCNLNKLLRKQPDSPSPTDMNKLIILMAKECIQ